MLADTGRLIARRAASMGLSRWSWGEGVVMHAALTLADALGNPIPTFVTAFVDEHLAAGVDIAHVNDLALGATCADLWLATGEPRYREACEQLLGWLRNDAGVTRAGNGAIEHWPGGVWADTVFMAGMFLIRYGLAVDRPDLVAEAGEQLVAHAQMLQHPGTGLYAHGSHLGETIWCFWGRANAWTALAAVEFLAAARRLQYPRVADLAESVTATLERQLLALADCQPEHGVWDVLVDGQEENRGIVETSAAAGIASAMLRAASLGIAPARTRQSGWQAITGVHAYVEPDGTLARTSAGTVLQLIPFGYSVIRSDRIQPWGQGLAMRAYADALTDLTTHKKAPQPS
ncbi:glycoside hydrolase family 88 protein [Micromonospora globispora]|uniref:glycoside hydrolase family 88 protein n=1 Tax=Micromonospora globispora TaxID=1450148 RepID=UPI001403C0CB|nr:glycoside hydrolase family 88 protein [Micromonospora globispora]